MKLIEQVPEPDSEPVAQQLVLKDPFGGAPRVADNGEGRLLVQQVPGADGGWRDLSGASEGRGESSAGRSRQFAPLLTIK